jgi:hypothetical protein
MSINITPLGVIIKSRAHTISSLVAQFKISEVSYYLYEFYGGNSYTTEVINYLLWNLDTGEGHVLVGPTGKGGTWYESWQDYDGTILHAISVSSSVGRVLRIDPVNATVTELVQTIQSVREVYSYADGYIIASTEGTHAYVYWYDPNTTTWSYYEIDPSHGLGYMYSEGYLSADRLYAYCRMQNTDNSINYIVAIKLSDNTQRVFYKDSINDSLLEKADHSQHFIEHRASPYEYWQLNGIDDLTLTSNSTAVNRYGWHTISYTVDITNINPTVDGYSTIATNIGPTCDTLQMVLVDDKPKVLRPAVDLLIGTASVYGPCFWLDPTTDIVSQLGYPQGNVYDIKWCPNTQRYLMAGYDSFFGEYNPLLPWSIATNPQKHSHSELSGSQDHYDRIESPKDKKYYFTVRNTGIFAWFNPTDWVNSHIDFAGSYDVISMAAIRGGSYIAISLYDGTGIGAIKLFHILSQTIIKTIIPEALTDFGMICEALRPGIDTLVEAKTNVGHIICIRGNQSSGCKAWRINTYTNEIIWSQAITGNVFYMAAGNLDSAIEMGPDGYIYFFVNNNLSKINPVDGTLTTVLTSAQLELLATGSSRPGKITWHKNNLYIYYGTDTNNVYRITGLV